MCDILVLIVIVNACGAVVKTLLQLHTQTPRHPQTSSEGRFVTGKRYVLVDAAMDILLKGEIHRGPLQCILGVEIMIDSFQVSRCAAF